MSCSVQSRESSESQSSLWICFTYLKLPSPQQSHLRQSKSKFSMFVEQHGFQILLLFSLLHYYIISPLRGNAQRLAFSSSPQEQQQNHSYLPSFPCKSTLTHTGNKTWSSSALLRTLINSLELLDPFIL